MNTSRRYFIRQSGMAALSAIAAPSFSGNITLDTISEAIASRKNLSPDAFAMEEDFWQMIRDAYTVSPAIINLNNGGVSPQPAKVQEMQYKYIQMSNEAPSYFMWRVLDMGREPLRQKLADLA